MKDEIVALTKGIAPVLAELVEQKLAPLRERIAFLEGIAHRDLGEGVSDPAKWARRVSREQ
jgi:hypothetical protein